MAKTFYKALAPGEIRLLRLLKAEQSEAIECEMKTVKLNNDVKYRALSYTWGPREMHDITVESLIVQVTRNLLVALKRLRREPNQPVWATPYEAEWLWIDAICINQDDLSERSSQVQMMGQIYKKAMEVVICYDESSQQWSGNDSRRYKQLEDVAREPQKHDLLLAVDYLEWAKIFTQPWVLRTWVVQEAVFGTDPQILYAGESITFTRFTSALRVLLEKTNADPWVLRSRRRMSESMQADLSDAFRSLKTIQELQILLQSGRKRSLLWLLRRLRSSQATDPKDKIFGLLSLAYDAEMCGRPDYEKSVAQVYIDFATTCLSRRPQCLRSLLSEAGLHKRARDQSISLPSWVPDWSCTEAARYYTFSETGTYSIEFDTDIGDAEIQPSGAPPEHMTTGATYASMREANPDHRSETFDLTHNMGEQVNATEPAAVWLDELAKNLQKSMNNPDIAISVSTKARMPEPRWVASSLISDAPDDLYRPRPGTGAHLKNKRQASTTEQQTSTVMQASFRLGQHGENMQLKIKCRIIDVIEAVGPPRPLVCKENSWDIQRWTSEMMGLDAWSVWQRESWLCIKSWLPVTSWLSWKTEESSLQRRMLWICSAGQTKHVQKTDGALASLYAVVTDATHALLDYVARKIPDSAPPQAKEELLKRRPRPEAVGIRAQDELLALMKDVTAGRALCLTQNGRKLGLVPGCTEAGDLIAVLDGMNSHVVLRKHEAQDARAAIPANYLLVGDAFIEDDHKEGVRDSTSSVRAGEDEETVDIHLI